MRSLNMALPLLKYQNYVIDIPSGYSSGFHSTFACYRSAHEDFPGTLKLGAIVRMSTTHDCELQSGLVMFNEWRESGQLYSQQCHYDEI